MLTDETRDTVAYDLFHTEAQIDACIGQAAALLSGVAKMRHDGEVSMLATQKPLARLADVQQLLSKVRLKLTGVHGDLAALLPRAALDLPWDCPCVKAETADEAALPA